MTGIELNGGREKRGSEKSILVLTPHCEEPQLASQIASLNQQTHTHWDRVEIAHRPNREAHQTLYRTIEANVGRYDLFLKLDGDMVLSRPDALASIADFMDRRPNLAHVEFALWDWMTDAIMTGVHVYRSGCRWPQIADPLFVDPRPETRGAQRIHDGPPAPFVEHMPDPSEGQAIRFGVHRALKAFQVHRSPGERRPASAYFQLRVLEAVWQHFLRTGDRRLALALWAASEVRGGRLGIEANERQTPGLEELLREAGDLNHRDLAAKVRAQWHGYGRRRFAWAGAIGQGTAARALLRRAAGWARDRMTGRRCFPYRPKTKRASAFRIESDSG